MCEVLVEVREYVWSVRVGMCLCLYGVMWCTRV